jgi:hypothetical protein
LKAQLKSIFSWDIPNGDLAEWTPPERDFGIYVMLFIGWEGNDSSDCFGLLICTPGWFSQNLKRTFVESGQYVIFMDEFDYAKFRSYIESYIWRCEGDTWPEVASELDHLASWEFKTFNSQISPRSIVSRLEPEGDSRPY